MKGYFGLGQLSPSEKSDILDQHKQVYNGYKSMLPQVSNTQPLYIQDYANDKNGITVNNKGEVKHYTNFGINEQAEKSQVCNECGGMVQEGECSECGISQSYMEEETGHLDDIYDEQDLDPKAGFDYIEGSSNDVDTFEDMHKKLYEDGDLDEQGGNSDDMNVDDVEPAFDFESRGPGMGDAYPVNEDGDTDESYAETEEGNNMDRPEITYDTMESAWADDNELDEVDISGVQGIYGDMDPAYDFDSEGPGKGGPYQEYHGHTAPSDKDENKVKFRPNVDLGKSFEKLKNKISNRELGNNELEPKEKSWEEITDYVNDEEFDEVDDDIKESLINQKNRIVEMMIRMNNVK